MDTANFSGADDDDEAWKLNSAGIVVDPLTASFDVSTQESTSSSFSSSSSSSFSSSSSSTSSSSSNPSLFIITTLIVAAVSRFAVKGRRSSDDVEQSSLPIRCSSLGSPFEPVAVLSASSLFPRSFTLDRLASGPLEYPFSPVFDVVHVVFSTDNGGVRPFVAFVVVVVILVVVFILIIFIINDSWNSSFSRRRQWILLEDQTALRNHPAA